MHGHWYTLCMIGKQMKPEQGWTAGDCVLGVGIEGQELVQQSQELTGFSWL